MDSSVIARQALRLCSVRSSFSPIFLLKPTISAARIAASFRLGVVFFIFIRQVGILSHFKLHTERFAVVPKCKVEHQIQIPVSILILNSTPAFYEEICLVCNVNALKSELLLPTLSTIKLRSLFFYHDHTWGNSSFLS